MKAITSPVGSEQNRECIDPICRHAIARHPAWAAGLLGCRENTVATPSTGGWSNGSAAKSFKVK
ncbi:MAG: hypothetical protein FWD79_08375 [Desulfobulbus sp.]|nr:hypothetical protein [Desulfobulbus sp.]